MLEIAGAYANARNTLESMVSLAPGAARRRQEGLAEACATSLVQRCVVASGDPGHERILMRAIQYVLTIFAGVVVGVLLHLAYQCGSTWHHGGSADPRCVF